MTMESSEKKIYNFTVDHSPADMAFREWAEQCQRDIIAELGYTQSSPDFDSAGYYRKPEPQPK